MTDTDTGTVESLALSIPDEHVGAFVAEVFEDAERSTTWTEVVDAMVAPAARDAWEALSATEQVIEVLEKAGEYDGRAVDTLEDVPLRGEEASLSTREAFEEALRYRRNADVLRDGIADAFASDVIDEATLEAAVEEFGFDTETIARREDALEDVASVYELDFRPYGGTLIQRDEEDTTAADAW
ncbi:hypothetical protein [Halorientalis halophila]|uniref:hypothetical protein n=1 Tax=Halorientalis halophila TaxID=3108499 RepID=UPI003009CFD4